MNKNCVNGCGDKGKLVCCNNHYLCECCVHQLYGKFVIHGTKCPICTMNLRIETIINWCACCLITSFPITEKNDPVSNK